MPDAPLSLRAYARRRGVSPEAVSKAVSAGRLTASVVTVGGHPKIGDPELADREWEAHTQRRTEYTAPEQPSERPDVQPAAALRSLIDDTPDGTPSLNASRAVRAHALARRDTAHADLAELELAAKRGRLVDAQAARSDVEQAYSLVKTRLLRVPSDLAQRLPHLAAEVVPVLEELQRHALEELSLP